MNNGEISTTNPGAAAVPSWIQKMRDAAQKVLSEADVEEIVRSQVAAAKKGDRNAIKFVFEQVLGGQQVKASTIVQNNYHGDAAVAEAARQSGVAHPRLADERPAPQWKCEGCGERTIDDTMPSKCRVCGKSRFTAVIRKAI